MWVIWTGILKAYCFTDCRNCWPVVGQRKKAVFEYPQPFKIHHCWGCIRYFTYRSRAVAGQVYLIAPI